MVAGVLIAVGVAMSGGIIYTTWMNAQV